MNLFEVYKLWDIEPVRGLDTTLWTADGTEYTDLYGGHAVISIGHCHPHYVEVVSRQLSRLGFYSNAVKNSLQTELAARLGRLSGYDDYSLFLCNSGAEANENAMKLASFATGRARVLAFSKAFHGRTSGAVGVTDNPKIRAPFNESGHVGFVSLGDIGAVERELSGGQYAAVIIEGIQGVAGIYEPSEDFLRELRRLCDRHGSLLIADEIQSGYGRSGRFFAHQFSGIRPDIITTAKGMANGFPIGGVLISPAIKPEYGMLGTTFGGNHLACAAALAVLDVIENEHLIENAARVGKHFRQAFNGPEGLDPALAEYRGKGLMIGLELKDEFIGLRDRLLFERHFFTGAAGPKVIRLLPSLTLSVETADRFIGSWRELTSNNTGK
ncbi:MAG: aspartate aminotransferase family protein [Bacteroidetes bacterium]|uniref:Aspartate aminotransferase family protein n=1 Tax=Candidatus Cryptobacteroides avistercoris TaxID=2840758 RepID=A0A9D9NNK5_9BACT|nr:aspartate aminotransferase family protein [Candidatus Cryptobacteroides avistercoris]